VRHPATIEATSTGAFDLSDGDERQSGWQLVSNNKTQMLQQLMDLVAS
jgi:hypothetical protein